MSLMTDYNLPFVKKVYCKDCKWTIDPKVCRHPKNMILMKEQTIFLHINHHFPGFTCNLNGDNDCPRYKRKWWKVWVR